MRTTPDITAFVVDDIFTVDVDAVEVGAVKDISITVTIEYDA